MELKDLIIEKAIQKVASRMEKKAFGLSGALMKPTALHNWVNQHITPALNRGINNIADLNGYAKWAAPGAVATARGLRWVRNNVAPKINNFNLLKSIDDMQQRFYDSAYQRNIMKGTVGPAPLNAGGEMGMMHNKNIGAQ